MSGIFEKIRRWLGIAPNRLPEPQDAFEQLDAVAPLKPALRAVQADDADSKYSYVCRETMLDREERIYGYDLSLTQRLRSHILKRSPLIQRVHDDIMLSNLAPLGVSSLLGHRFAFIHLSPISLKNPLLEAFSRANVVVVITLGEITATDLSEVHADLQRLEEMGIRHGWKLNKPQPEISEAILSADFIEIETAAFDGIELKMLCRKLLSIQKRPKLIASEVQTSDDFDLCYRCGVDYFMGPFVSSRENWHPAKSEINRLRVLEVLNMVRAGAKFDVIADCLRTEPLLTFKLLRYINSPGIGLLKKIDEISQALQVLGSERFYRWLSLLLFDFTQLGYRERILHEQALTRARFMEMLAAQGRVPPDTDQLFITGLFSLLDVMMGQSISDILKQVSLPEQVAAALKKEEGPMRDTLLLAISIESGTPEEMAAAAAKCGLEAKMVTNAMIGALAWSQQMASVGE